MVVRNDLALIRAFVFGELFVPASAVLSHYPCDVNGRGRAPLRFAPAGDICGMTGVRAAPLIERISAARELHLSAQKGSHAMHTQNSSRSFRLGQIFITPGALEVLESSEQQPNEFLKRHARCDWGLVDEDDQRENDLSLERGFRILSAYKTSEGERIWIITEGDRSATTILLPSEY
jgi:hypothetical protein